MVARSSLAKNVGRKRNWNILDTRPEISKFRETSVTVTLASFRSALHLNRSQGTYKGKSTKTILSPRTLTTLAKPPLQSAQVFRRAVVLLDISHNRKPDGHADGSVCSFESVLYKRLQLGPWPGHQPARFTTIYKMKKPGALCIYL